MDRLGILLQFASFWFILPEIIGGERVQRLGDVVVRFLSTTLFAVLTITVVIIAWSFALRESYLWLHRVGLALLLSSLILIPKFLIYRRLQTIWIPALIKQLTNNRRLRRAFFVVGVIMLTIGTALQIAATF